ERYAEEQRRLSTGNTAQQRANLKRSLETVGADIEILEERITVQRALLDDGLITEQTLLTTEQELNTARDTSAALSLELSGLQLERLESEQQLEQQVEIKRGTLRDLELELAEQRAAMAENLNVVAPTAGRVLELTADRGDFVNPGTPILTMEMMSEDLVAVLFVPASQGKQIQPGMAVRVVPSSIKREEFGYIRGSVVRVAEFPSTSRGMRRLLANEELVSKLMQTDPPIRVDVKLEADPSTSTGFRWSSSRGPDIEISSGTLAGGSVIVREDRPLSLIVPRIREQLGV
ncbi:MAG: NHLP bacteriocin system secretion protein, partial [Acidobacteriota bacterium]